MTYDSAPALRAALEQRLSNRAAQTGLGLDRLRRGVLFERIVARLEAALPTRFEAPASSCDVPGKSSTVAGGLGVALERIRGRSGAQVEL